MRPYLLLLVAALAQAAPAAATTIGPLANPANGHRYYVKDDPMTWAAAEAWAVALGGHLVTIQDDAENAWVASILTLQTDFHWIGARDDANTTDDVFEWSSGEPWGYARWSPGEPDDDAAFGGQGDYVLIDRHTANWFDANGIFFQTGGVAEVVTGTGVDPGTSPGDGALEVRGRGDGARVRFQLPRPMPIRLRIFDVLGRPLRTLTAGTLPAGPHEIVWDGRGEAGHDVASGLYFVFLEAEEIRRSRRVPIAR